MPIIQPAYPNPPRDLPWGYDLIRQLAQRDQLVSNALAPQTAFMAMATNTQQFNNVATPLAFDSVHFDLGNRFDLTNGTFNAPVRGIYTFTAGLTFDDTFDVDSVWTLDLSTVDYQYNSKFKAPSVAAIFGINVTVPGVLMERGQTARFFCSRVAGTGILDTTGASGDTWFGGHLIEVA